MNKNIMRQAGFGEEVDLVNQGKCPDCKEDIDMSSFRNPISIKEFRISGMCQKCQDDLFGVE